MRDLAAQLVAARATWEAAGPLPVDWRATCALAVLFGSDAVGVPASVSEVYPWLVSGRVRSGAWGDLARAVRLGVLPAAPVERFRPRGLVLASSRSLLDLQPRARAAALWLQGEAPVQLGAGRVTFAATARDCLDQDRQWWEGDSEAAGGESLHQFGLAFDAYWTPSGTTELRDLGAVGDEARARFDLAAALTWDRGHFEVR